MLENLLKKGVLVGALSLSACTASTETLNEYPLLDVGSKDIGISDVQSSDVSSLDGALDASISDVQVLDASSVDASIPASCEQVRFSDGKYNLSDFPYPFKFPLNEDSLKIIIGTNDPVEANIAAADAVYLLGTPDTLELSNAFYDDHGRGIYLEDVIDSDSADLRVVQEGVGDVFQINLGEAYEREGLYLTPLGITDNPGSKNDSVTLEIRSSIPTRAYLDTEVPDLNAQQAIIVGMIESNNAVRRYLNSSIDSTCLEPNTAYIGSKMMDNGPVIMVIASDPILLKSAGRILKDATQFRLANHSAVKIKGTEETGITIEPLEDYNP